MFISQGEADKVNLVFNDEYPVGPWQKTFARGHRRFELRYKEQ